MREGRLIFDNLKKCIAYVLSSNIPEIIPFLLLIAIKIPIALETVMILFIDLGKYIILIVTVGTDIAPAVALAYEDGESFIMQMKPRARDDHLVGFKLMINAYGTIGIFETISAFFAFFWLFNDWGISNITIIMLRVHSIDAFGIRIRFSIPL